MTFRSVIEYAQWLNIICYEYWRCQSWSLVIFKMYIPAKLVHLWWNKNTFSIASVLKKSKCKHVNDSKRYLWVIIHIVCQFSSSQIDFSLHRFSEIELKFLCLKPHYSVGLEPNTRLGLRVHRRPLFFSSLVSHSYSFLVPFPFPWPRNHESCFR